MMLEARKDPDYPLRVLVHSQCQLFSFFLPEGTEDRWFPLVLLPLITSLSLPPADFEWTLYSRLPVSHLVFWRHRCSAALSSCGPLNYKYQTELTLLMPHRVLIRPLSLSLPPSLSSWLSRLISHQVQLDRAPSSVCSLLPVLQFSESSFSSFSFISYLDLLLSLSLHGGTLRLAQLVSSSPHSLPPSRTTSVLLRLSFHMNNKLKPRDSGKWGMTLLILNRTWEWEKA